MLLCNYCFLLTCLINWFAYTAEPVTNIPCKTAFAFNAIKTIAKPIPTINNTTVIYLSGTLVN